MKGIVSSFDVLWFRNEGNVEAAAEALVAGGGHVEQVTFNPVFTIKKRCHLKYLHTIKGGCRFKSWHRVAPGQAAQDEGGER